MNKNTFKKKKLFTNPKPGMKLLKSSGDPLVWKTFQETNETAIGNTESLSEVARITVFVRQNWKDNQSTESSWSTSGTSWIIIDTDCIREITKYYKTSDKL